MIFAPGPEGLVYLFPGQGSQAVGMSQGLAEFSAAARETLAEADSVLGMPLSRMCAEGPEADLTDTVNTQPALLAVSIAAWRAAKELLVQLPQPIALAGHSMGEYSALVAAEALTFADGLRLVRERGRLMKEAGASQPGRMAAVLGMDSRELRALCAEVVGETGSPVQIANDNHQTQQVISGALQGVTEVSRLAKGRGARRVLPLAVSIAAHSPLMSEAGPRWQGVLEGTAISVPLAPLIGNTSAKPLTDPEGIRAELAAQLEGGVLWWDSMQTLTGMGATAAAEFGSGSVLTGIQKKIAPKMPCFALRNGKDLQGWQAWLEHRQCG